MDEQEQQPVILNRNTRVVNVGYDLRKRLEAVAAREGMDGTTLGRRIVEAGVAARERTEEAGEHDD